MQELDARSLHLMRKVQEKGAVVPVVGELDALCEIGVRATGADVGVVTLVQGKAHQIVGRYGTDMVEFPRADEHIFAEGQTAVLLDLQNHPVLAGHPVVNGGLDTICSAIVMPMRVENDIVGIVALGSRKREALFRGVERDILKKIAHAAEASVLAQPGLREIAAAARLR